MENENNVDNLFFNNRKEYVFQQIKWIYTHKYKKCVDNVEKLTHIKNPVKSRLVKFEKIEIHIVYIKLCTKYPQNVDKYFF